MASLQFEPNGALNPDDSLSASRETAKTKPAASVYETRKLLNEASAGARLQWEPNETLFKSATGFTSGPQLKCVADGYLPLLQAAAEEAGHDAAQIKYLKKETKPSRPLVPLKEGMQLMEILIPREIAEHPAFQRGLLRRNEQIRAASQSDSVMATLLQPRAAERQR